MLNGDFLETLGILDPTLLFCLGILYRRSLTHALWWNPVVDIASRILVLLSDAKDLGSQTLILSSDIVDLEYCCFGRGTCQL